MPAKRSLRLEAPETNKKEKTKATARYDPSSYSPLTGTRQFSPSSASRRRAAADARERRKQYDAGSKAAGTETSSRGQTSPKGRDQILELFSKIEGSLNEFLQMRQRLRSLQAAGGSRELENLLGTDNGELDLKTELQKTKVLICEVRKRKKR